MGELERIRAATERAIAAMKAHRDAGPSIMGETPLITFHNPPPEPARPSWREKTELEKAVAYEAIRGRLPDVWTLLDIVESANPPEHIQDECGDVTFGARDGWSVTFFYDCNELDYIDNIINPDNLVIHPWDWPHGAPGRQVRMNWRAVGDRERLLALLDEYPARTIECTALQGDLPVTEEESDDVMFGRIDLLGGYLDCDALVVRRTPVPEKEAEKSHCPCGLPYSECTDEAGCIEEERGGYGR